MAVGRDRRVNDLKGRHFGGEIVLWAVRWYRRYAVSYRDLEAMMTERAFGVGPGSVTEAMAGPRRSPPAMSTPRQRPPEQTPPSF